MDTYFFLLINHGLQNSFFDIAMPFLTHKGYLLFIAIISPLFFKDWRKGILIFILGAAGYIIADNSGDILKDIFARLRPCRTLQDVRLLVNCPKSFSFPSGHASTSFAMASIIGHLFRRAAVPAFLLAALVAFSRIYVGVHYPADVIGGAVWGGVTAGVILYLQKLIADQIKKKAS